MTLRTELEIREKIFALEDQLELMQHEPQVKSAVIAIEAQIRELKWMLVENRSPRQQATQRRSK